MNFVSLILALTIVAGQLIKIPVTENSGLTLLDIILVLLNLLGLYQIKFRLKKPPLYIKSALIFTFVGTISLSLTPLHLQSSEYIISFFYTVRFMSFVLFGWLIYSGAFASFKNQTNNLLIYSGVGLSILGLLQFLFLPNLSFLTAQGWDPHYFRTVSTFLDPNFAGAYFVLTLLLIHCLDIPPFTKRAKWLFFAFVYLALLTTFSRSSYLMFLVGGVLLSYFKKSKNLFTAVILLFSVLMAGFYLYTQLVARPRNINREQSASFRLNTWQQGFTLFQNSPVLGVGFNAYRFALKEFKLGDEEFLKSHGASSNDSSLLFVASTTGIIGLISYLFFLGILIKAGWKQNFILTSALFGLIVHSFFANSLFYPPILGWIILSASAPKK